MPHPAILPPDEARRRVHERGYSLPYVGAPTGAKELRVHMSVIDPGERAHPPHDHPDEEVLFLLDSSSAIVSGGRW